MRKKAKQTWMLAPVSGTLKIERLIESSVLIPIAPDEPAPYYETNPGTTTSNNQWSNAPAGWTRSSPLTTTPLQQQSFSYNRNERLFNNQEKISKDYST